MFGLRHDDHIAARNAFIEHNLTLLRPRLMADPLGPQGLAYQVARLNEMYMRVNHPHLDDDFRIPAQDEYQVPPDFLRPAEGEVPPEVGREEDVEGEKEYREEEALSPREGAAPADEAAAQTEAAPNASTSAAVPKKTPRRMGSDRSHLLFRPAEPSTPKEWHAELHIDTRNSSTLMMARLLSPTMLDSECMRMPLFGPFIEFAWKLEQHALEEAHDRDDYALRVEARSQRIVDIRMGRAASGRPELFSDRDWTDEQMIKFFEKVAEGRQLAFV